ncbi:MAG TPA: hypothetical protein VGL22_13375 [Terracidiphilus sp.]
MGSINRAEAGPGIVSVKPTVIWYVPAGVVEEVVTVTALRVDE